MRLGRIRCMTKMLCYKTISTLLQTLFNVNGILSTNTAFYMHKVLKNSNESSVYGFLLSPYCQIPGVACTHTAEPRLALARKQLRLSVWLQDDNH